MLANASPQFGPSAPRTRWDQPCSHPAAARDRSPPKVNVVFREGLPPCRPIFDFSHALEDARSLGAEKTLLTSAMAARERGGRVRRLATPTHPFLTTMIGTQMEGWFGGSEFGLRSSRFCLLSSVFCILRLPVLSPCDEIFRNAG